MAGSLVVSLRASHCSRHMGPCWVWLLLIVLFLCCFGPREQPCFGFFLAPMVPGSMVSGIDSRKTLIKKQTNNPPLPVMTKRTKRKQFPRRELNPGLQGASPGAGSIPLGLIKMKTCHANRYTTWDENGKRSQWRALEMTRFRKGLAKYGPPVDAKGHWK